MTMTTMLIWPLKQWMVRRSCSLGKHVCCLRTAGLKAVSELFPSQLYHMTHKRKRACRICGVCKCSFLGGNNLISLGKLLLLRCWKSIWTFSQMTQHRVLLEWLNKTNAWPRSWIQGTQTGSGSLVAGLALSLWPNNSPFGEYVFA